MTRKRNLTAQIKPATRNAILDHDAIEHTARQLCADAGRDFDAKGCKRTHWRKKAAEIHASLQAAYPEPRIYERVKDALANIMGGRW